MSRARPALSPRGRTRLIIGGLIGAGLLTVLGANAHLVYVAFASQPACVDHVKAPAADRGFRAAKSAC